MNLIEIYKKLFLGLHFSLLGSFKKRFKKN